MPLVKCYIRKTNNIRGSNQALFLQLKRLYTYLSSKGIANILKESIKLAGSDVSMYSAKNFRPTGATCQIVNGADPDTVQKVGRWKTRSVFLIIMFMLKLQIISLTIFFHRSVLTHICLLHYFSLFRHIAKLICL